MAIYMFKIKYGERNDRKIVRYNKYAWIILGLWYLILFILVLVLQFDNKLMRSFMTLDITFFVTRVIVYFYLLRQENKINKARAIVLKNELTKGLMKMSSNI